MAKDDPKPRVSVIDRRLQNPFGEPSAEIQLKDKSLRPRWFNAAIIADKIWRAKHNGWTIVKKAEIVDTDQIGAFSEGPDGAIVRGERGQEVLMSMPRDDYRALELAKDRFNRRNMGDSEKATNDAIEAAGEKFGDEAANFLQKSRGFSHVRDSYERVQRDAE